MLAFYHIYKIAREQKKYQNLEMGWTLEDNESIQCTDNGNRRTNI